MLRFVLACLLVATSVHAEPMSATGTVEVLFSPAGGAAAAIVRELDAAKPGQDILVQAYSFTSKAIAEALLAAHKRGVNITVILDRSQRTERYSSATFLSNVGISVLIDDSHAIAHNKVIIIARSVLITGSFNFTSAAESRNAENLLVLKGNQALVDAYIANFERHRAHSVAYIAIGVETPAESTIKK